MYILINFVRGLPGNINQGLIWGIMAIGLYITYKVLDVSDLTVDGSFCTGGAVAAMMIMNGCNAFLAILCSLAAGMVAGFVTGLLHTRLGIPAILSGILTQLGLYSINYRIMNKSATVTVSRTKYNLLLTMADNYKALIVTVLATAIIILILYWFFGTELGCSVRATGDNPHMARAQGINVDNVKVFGLMLGNGLVGLSGGIIAQYQGNSDINMGRGAIVIGLAAIIIGEAFSKKIGNFAVKLLFTSIGAVVYFTVQALVIQLGLESSDLKLFSAIVVMVFLGVPYITNKVKSKRKNIAAKKDAGEAADV